MKKILSVSPHMHSGNTTQEIMLDVIIGLIPATFAALIFFGIKAFVVIIVSIVSCVLTEILFQYMFKKKITINDYSAVVTGLLLAFVLPPTTKLWAVALGAFVSIGIAKHLFGGLGFNIFNPALVGRAFLLASYPVMITTWVKPFSTVTGATPLGLLQSGAEQLPSLGALVVGSIGGSIGETSAVALLLGAAYLFYKEVIDWRIPVSYILTVALFALAVGQDPLFHIFAGGLMLGAFFMATDYSTSPMTTKGKLIFGFGCGLLTVLIRLYGGYPEGVCYSILIMNMFVPLLDRIK